MTVQINTIKNQIDHLINLGFPELLKLSDQEYANTFRMIGDPTFPGYKNRFDFPVVVDPRLPVAELIAKAGINNYLKYNEIAHLSGGLPGPYIFFTHDSKRYASHSAASAVSKFAPDEVGCTLQELIFFYLYEPRFFEGISMDAILTNFRQDDYHPCIVRVTDRAEIGAHWHNDVSAGMNILSKGDCLYKFGLDGGNCFNKKNTVE
ncbi:MAG: hypothetical protein A2W95_04825 [Bacteroidetes bacterium GWA2_40_14]|nr:MAG: hypothetical protein A2W95_04825 [Bacteroidetes bacterium GWA2_40_14]HAZ00836.1 hypothetical protein [Marinilabiliales bacterium]